MNVKNNSYSRIRIVLLSLTFCIAASDLLANNLPHTGNDSSNNDHHIVQFIFCGDLHFGLTKAKFKNQTNISAAAVNTEMARQMNFLSDVILPNDNGVCAGEKVGNIDAVIVAGDIANRQEKGIQSAADSWEQFKKIYIDGLQLKNNSGNKTELLLTPGNHDITDAIGYYKPMKPLTDNTALFEMYNLMIHPAVLKISNNFNYLTDKIYYSKNINNIHFIFVDAWPDSTARVWMEQDLKTVSDTTPVLLFTHAMPDVEARFFTNPNSNHSINENDKFENLLNETFKDGFSTEDTSWIEQAAFENFLKLHPNIQFYFHGHNNYTEYYDWKGTDKNILLHCIRVDSPMKGKYSSKDEMKLSFELITIDIDKKILTVRECLWNNDPNKLTSNIEWGISENFSLKY